MMGIFRFFVSLFLLFLSTISLSVNSSSISLDPEIHTITAAYDETHVRGNMIYIPLNLSHLAADDAVLSVTGFGDLSSTGEFVEVYFGDSLLGQLFSAQNLGCDDWVNSCQDHITVSKELINNSVSEGVLNLQFFIPPSNGAGWVDYQEIKLSYTGEVHTDPSELNLESGLVAHYKFDGDFTDSSGSGNHGAQQGGVTFVEGINGQAAYFDGNDDLVSVPHTDSLALDQSLSISLWLRPEYQDPHSIWGDTTIILIKNNHVGNNYSLWTERDARRFAYQQYYLEYPAFYGNTPYTFNVEQSILSNDFVNIIVVRSSNSLKMYLDGNEVFSQEINYSSKLGSSPLTIGGGNVYNKYRGYIDDLKIYNRVLSETEIMNLVSSDDVDNDGLPNDYEAANGLNPDDSSDAQSDSDMDGLTALEEFNLGTSPTNDDTDRDTLPDGWEVENGRDPLVADYDLSVSQESSCAIDDGGVICWGRNDFYQTDVPELNEPKRIYAGDLHVCAIDNGGITCWGQNDWNQLNAPNISDVSKLSLGGQHSCAISDGEVFCWGRNSEGQTNVPELNNVTDIATGWNHSCAISDSGVSCWGLNDLGQIDVPVLINPKSIYAGVRHTCAIDDNGAVCWGNNEFGQSDVPQLNNVKYLSLGWHHTCAIDGTQVTCWGDNSSGKISPPQLDNPQVISSGYYHTCSLSNIGVSCWGDNTFGQSNAPNLAFDPDSDGFSNQNEADPFPLDATEWLDTDSDGIGNNTDIDDDNDGFEDTLEFQNGLDPLVANPDIDNDGIANVLDNDNDNDGSLDSFDAFPLDANEQIDSDADGVGDNADADNDNDGVINSLDIFPLDALESADSDGDGIGDNTDFFPNSAEYSLDSDLDQMPDAWERKYGLNPSDASDALLDQDNDGLTALEEYEAGTIPLKILDIDADGSVDALTDGLIILRYLFNLRGDNLVNGAVAENAMRTEAADIEAYIESLIPGI